VEKIPTEFSGTVEALNITSSSTSSSFYEGTFTNAVTTKSLNRTITLPAGSFSVSTAQKNAGLAFIALEASNNSRQ
jgi:hypothetical protein